MLKYSLSGEARKGKKALFFSMAELCTRDYTGSPKSSTTPWADLCAEKVAEQAE